MEARELGGGEERRGEENGWKGRKEVSEEEKEKN